MLATESQTILDALGAETVTYKRRIDEWNSPTGHIASDWVLERRAYDGNAIIPTTINVATQSWSSFLILTHSGVHSNKVRFDALKYHATDIPIDIDVYQNGEWVDVYKGNDYNDHTWTEKTFEAGIVTQIRIRFWNDNPFHSFIAGVYEVEIVKAFSERSINAIVNRRQPAQISGQQGNAPLLEITVANDSSIGISSDEINLGQDLISLPVRIGEAAQDRRIAKILGMDSGMMKLEVR